MKQLPSEARRHLIGDWTVVGGVRCDDSLRVHHLLAGQIEFAHLLQAGVFGRFRKWRHTQEMLISVMRLISDVGGHSRDVAIWRENVPLQLGER